MEILAITLPLLGILNAIAYYQYFEINITEYLSFDEAITLFLNNILDVLGLLLGLLGVEFFIMAWIVGLVRTKQ
ncbi:MAG: hypothetical protein H3C64_13970 [Candidatus Kuenenia stuttgartiensis]|nr:hypothetical protein [Candidatus Kuenenia stuttgartiensis]